MKDYLPAREAEYVTWVTNFKSKIAASPTIYGLTADQATNYTDLFDVYFPLYTAAKNPATRSPAKISAKSDARKTLTRQTRILAAVANAYPAITNELRIELGLHPRTDERTSIPPPEVSPKMDILSVVGRVVKVRLHDGSPKRAKPPGVATATVFSYIGETAGFHGSPVLRRPVRDAEMVPLRVVELRVQELPRH
jgi:hypothetical protein